MDDILTSAAKTIAFNKQQLDLSALIQQEDVEGKKFGLENSKLEVEKYVLDKKNIINELIGLNKKDQLNLVSLFNLYFNKKANPVFTLSDLQVITTFHPEFKSLLTSTHVKSGKYKTNSKSYLILELDGKYIIGSSSVEKSIWFVFTNDKADVNNGIIYCRDSSIKSIKQFSTFEINAFSSSKVVVEDSETKQKVLKDKLTYIPNWLVNTVTNMQRHVFYPIFKY